MVQVYLPGKHPILPEVPVGSKIVGTHPMSPWVVEANSINKELFLMVKNQHCISLYKSNCIYYYIILYNTTDKYILYIIYYNIYIYISPFWLVKPVTNPNISWQPGPLSCGFVVLCRSKGNLANVARPARTTELSCQGC